MRHAASATIICFALLLAAGVPFLRVNLASPDHRSLPSSAQSRQVSEALTRDFGIHAYPIQIAYVAQGNITQPDNIAKLYDYTKALSKLGNVTKVDSITTVDTSLSKQQYQTLYRSAASGPDVQLLLEQRVKNNVTTIDVTYPGNIEDAATQKLVADIRNLPAPGGTQVKVGGEPAELTDLLTTLRTYIPYGLAVIVVSMFVLLFLMLGSIVVPLKAILMNILSLSATYGVLVLVFQEGNLASLFNFTQTNALDATIPVLIFAIAFGMSMDYAVFLYSRIKEHYDKTGDNTAAVLWGLHKTGPIITSAALLLFVVVAAFATARVPLMQQIGLGLSLTVLIDAFIVRMILVPSLMKPLNHYNWWAPRALKKLQKSLGMEH